MAMIATHNKIGTALYNIFLFAKNDVFFSCELKYLKTRKIPKEQYIQTKTKTWENSTFIFFSSYNIHNLRPVQHSGF